MMMKTLNTLIVLALMLVAQMAISQRTYDIRFILDDVDCMENTACYITQIRAADGQGWNLAGQNYRIFYDASMASYIDGSAENLLSDAQYFLDKTQIQDAQEVDASAFGFSLDFAANLSFLNYSIDLMTLSTGGANLPATGEWISTSKLCFNVPEEATTDPNLCLELVWARMGRTDDYATAFVEVSQWVQSNSTTDAVTNIYDDLDSEDSADACLAGVCDPTLDLETSETACMDGIDNDLDGLIDCADPLCAVFCPSDATLYDISLDLNSVDCISGTACYSVNLRSATDKTFILGSQEYRFFYNSMIGRYLSGESKLGSDYQPLILQDGTPVENRDATGVGSLPYESNLGYLSFSIQLNDNATGGDETISSAEFTTVAELCFAMSASAINDGMVCFEADWANEGTTDVYETQFLEIQEWIAANSVGPVAVDSIININAARGNDACFSSDCIAQEIGDVNCSDGIDNDNDGLIDCDDPSCSNAAGCIETCTSVGAPSLSGLNNPAIQCDYVTGPVELTSIGGSMAPGYVTTYLLTDQEGNILQISDSPNFDIGQESYYRAYAVNYKMDIGITGITIGGNINGVTSDCLEISAPYSFAVCSELDVCNYCLGETITLDPVVVNDGPEFTTQYVLTNKSGVIINIYDTPVLDSLSAGVYLLFPVNYQTTPAPSGIAKGEEINNIVGTLLDISIPYVIGICDQLRPSIFFNLNGCNITQTAELVVGGIYDSYMWSTGATTDFISVSATEPNTYRVTVTLSNGCIGIVEQEITGEEISTIGDFVWEDTNNNGRQDVGETGLNGVTVRLYADFDRNGVPDIPDFASCSTVTSNNPVTGAPGFYQFFVYQSNYVVEFIAPSGFVPTEGNQGDDTGDSDININTGFTSTISVSPSQTVTNVDGGFRTSAAICGSVWEDLDADGRREAGEMNQGNVVVNLYTAAGSLLSSTTTSSDTSSLGLYCFEEIPVQPYYVEVVLPTGSVLSPSNVGTNDELDSEGTEANGPFTTSVINTTSGGRTEGIDFGYYLGGSVCGIVFRDILGGTSAVYDAGFDSVIVNSLVLLIDPNTNDTIRTTATGADGKYCFNDVPVGSYEVRFGVSQEMNSFLELNQGTDPLIDSDVNPSSGATAVIFVASAEVINGINAGIRMSALPVEFLSFTGYWDEVSGVNILDWSTAIEINNDYFEIERLINLDGNFVSVGSVPGSGTTSDIRTYQFIDKDTDRSGNYYYRIRQVDVNGGSDVSEIIAIKVGNEKARFSTNKMLLFPNPAKDRLQLIVQAEAQFNASFVIVDITGKIVRSFNNINLVKGDNVIKIELDGIGTGSYVLRGNTGTKQIQELLQVVK